MDYVATIQTIAQRSLFVFLPFLTCVTFLLSMLLGFVLARYLIRLSQDGQHLIGAVTAGVGVASNDHPEAEPYLFWLFVALVLVHHAVVSVLTPASRDARACGDGRA